MFLEQSSLYSAIFIVLACTLAVQETAAQAVLCGQYQNLTSTSGQYMSKSRVCASDNPTHNLTRILVQNNAWGADGSGSQCTTVKDEQNGTAFSTTWSWRANETYASQTQVHSYANVKSRSETLPVRLSNVSALTVSANWSMYPSGFGDSDIFDIDGLDDIGAKADVTLDFFLDPDINQSTNVVNPKFEVMIWFANVDATEPIGYASGSAGSIILDGKNYTLFVGQNEQVAGQGNVPGQEVFSFVAPENMTSFSQLDVFPLFQYLLDGKRMANSTYLGTAQFGSEAFHTYGNNVTFEASGVDMYINTTAIPPTKTKGSPAKTNGATITTGASAKSHTASAKSNAVSLRGVEGFHWCWGLFEGAMGAMGAWMLWSWIL